MTLKIGDTAPVILGVEGWNTTLKRCHVFVRLFTIPYFPVWLSRSNCHHVGLWWRAQPGESTLDVLWGISSTRIGINCIFSCCCTVLTPKRKRLRHRPFKRLQTKRARVDANSAVSSHAWTVLSGEIAWTVIKLDCKNFKSLWKTWKYIVSVWDETGYDDRLFSLRAPPSVCVL